jgi:hypothetical protein
MLFLESAAKTACLALFFTSTSALASSSLPVAEEAVEVNTLHLKRRNEFVVLEGHKVRDSYQSPLPYTYIQQEDLPVRCVVVTHTKGVHS